MSWWSSRSAPPSPQVVVETAPKRVRTDDARPSSTAALPTSNSFEALADRKPEPRENLSLQGSMHAPANATSTATPAPNPPEQQPSYAQATRGDPQPSRRNKRKGGSQPSGMPEKERGVAWFKHPRLESYLRPAPRNVQKNVLWLDLTPADPIAPVLTPAAALAEAFTVIGNDAVGYVTAGGARSIGVVFPSAELRTKYDGKHLESGLQLYSALSSSAQAPIRRLTLQGVPVEDKLACLDQIKKIFEPFGELLEVVPLVLSGTLWASDTMHITIAEFPGQEYPETVTLMGATVLVHIPGSRRVCPHCKSVAHTDKNCRTAQRQQQQQQRQQQQPHTQQQQSQRPKEQQPSKTAAAQPSQPSKTVAAQPSQPRSSSRAEKSWEDQTEAEIEADTMTGVEETVLDHDNEDLTADGHRTDFHALWADDVDANGDIILRDSDGHIIYNDDDSDNTSGSGYVTPTDGSQTSSAPPKRVTRSHKA